MFGRRKKNTPNPVAAVVAREESLAAQAAVPEGMIPAPGSFGEVALHTVNERVAAMLMAIVADDLGCEPNELKFISIRELGRT